MKKKNHIQLKTILKKIQNTGEKKMIKCINKIYNNYKINIAIIHGYEQPFVVYKVL